MWLLLDADPQQGYQEETVEYYHAVLAAAIVGPGTAAAVPLSVEIIRLQDGPKKRDCERNAAKRWLGGICPSLTGLEPVCLGDDIYACESSQPATGIWEKPGTDTPE